MYTESAAACDYTVRFDYIIMLRLCVFVGRLARILCIEPGAELAAFFGHEIWRRITIEYFETALPVCAVVSSDIHFLCGCMLYKGTGTKFYSYS
jgi:hypothetical protein